MRGESEIHLVCGGREFSDRRRMERYIVAASEAIARQGREFVVVHGGARGADRLAGEVASEHGIKVVVFEAEWDRHGKSAGYKRNSAMARHLLDESASTGARVKVIAFPGGKGTDHMRRIAHEMELPVFGPPK